jgi:hypothetical protein
MGGPRHLGRQTDSQCFCEDLSALQEEARTTLARFSDGVLRREEITHNRC